MGYPYPGTDKSGHAIPSSDTIPNLTRTSKGKIFCKALSSFHAIRFDDVKNLLASYRKGRFYRSTDGYFKNSRGQYVFLEFKRSRIASLQAIGRNGKKPPTIQVSLRQKAIDSLSVAAYTELRQVPMATIQSNAVLIVVHMDDPKNPSLQKMGNQLRALGTSSKSPPPTAILWGLAPLKNDGFFSEVFTWPESVFVTQASTYLV